MKGKRILIYLLSVIIFILIIVFTVYSIIMKINAEMGYLLFIVLIISLFTSLLAAILIDLNKNEINILKKQIIDLQNNNNMLKIN
jgi:hypothetical protein